MARLSWRGWLVTYRDKCPTLGINPDTVRHPSIIIRSTCCLFQYGRQCCCAVDTVINRNLSIANVILLWDFSYWRVLFVCQQFVTTHTDTHTHTRTHTGFYQVARKQLWKLQLATCWTSQLPTTSQHHSPTWILPRNHTNSRIHTHATPTQTDFYGSHSI